MSWIERIPTGRHGAEGENAPFLSSTRQDHTDSQRLPHCWYTADRKEWQQLADCSQPDSATLKACRPAPRLRRGTISGSINVEAASSRYCHAASTETPLAIGAWSDGSCCSHMDSSTERLSSSAYRSGCTQRFGTYVGFQNTNSSSLTQLRRQLLPQDKRSPHSEATLSAVQCSAADAASL